MSVCVCVCARVVYVCSLAVYMCILYTCISSDVEVGEYNLSRCVSVRVPMCVCVCAHVLCMYPLAGHMCILHMCLVGWLRSVGSIKL